MQRFNARKFGLRNEKLEQTAVYTRHNEGKGPKEGEREIRRKNLKTSETERGFL